MFLKGEINDNNLLELLYPQKRFLDTIDNKRNTPFKPKLINGKSNSKIPLNLQLIGDKDNKHYGHPYQHEINNIKYCESQLKHRSEEEAQSMYNCDVCWIDSEDALSEMCQILSCCQEIGVDLEHHSKYTFAGLTCLIQISTRNRDYIIDTLALRKCIHNYLNPIFTDPNIVKILHGAGMDIQWLQRDFSVYIVNLFDTFEAAKLLKLQQKSLKYLLKTYCGIDTNKKLRLTDWRVRPLRPELIEYARKDTHYLLYIYDHLTNLLLDTSTKNKDLLKECYNNSAKTCLIRYNKPCFNAKGWQYLCQKKGWYFINNKSLNALSKLYEWRDRIARELDQSIEIVLSNKLLRKIVNDLPQNEHELLNSKKYYLSIIARKYYKDILNIINESVNMDDKDSIDPMFEASNECKNDGETKEEVHMIDIHTICNSNDGCFGNIVNDDKDSKMEVDESDVIKLDMMPNQTEDDESEMLFFPSKDKDIDEQDNNAQNIANDIFNQISNESVSKLIQQSIKLNEIGMNKQSKQKRVNQRRNFNNRQQKQINTNNAKLKRNNVDIVADPDNRDKIFGSRYVDRNSKKDVFKLPRNNNDKKKNRKRKGKNIDNDGPTLDNMQRVKKRKLSKYEKLKEKLKNREQKKRMDKTTGVEDEWPINKQNTDNSSKKKKKKTANKTKDQNANNEKSKNVNNDIKMTESDILDAAPIPVIDTKFDNVYDPFKGNLPS